MYTAGTSENVSPNATHARSSSSSRALHSQRLQVPFRDFLLFAFLEETGERIRAQPVTSRQVTSVWMEVFGVMLKKGMRALR
jgi:hypothetical protein